MDLEQEDDELMDKGIDPTPAPLRALLPKFKFAITSGAFSFTFARKTKGGGFCDDHPNIPNHSNRLITSNFDSLRSLEGLGPSDVVL